MSGTVVGSVAGSAGASQGSIMASEASKIASEGGNMFDPAEYELSYILPVASGITASKASTASVNLTKPGTALAGSVVAPIASVAGLGASGVGLAGLGASAAVQGSKAGLVASGVQDVTSLFTETPEQKLARLKAIEVRKMARAGRAETAAVVRNRLKRYGIPTTLSAVVPSSFVSSSGGSDDRSSSRRSTRRRSTRR